jgi:hypothetical protein
MGVIFIIQGSGSMLRKLPQRPPIGQVGLDIVPWKRAPPATPRPNPTPKGTYRTACPSACLKRQLLEEGHRSFGLHE